MRTAFVVPFSDEVQERPCGKREQRRGSLVAAGQPGPSAVRSVGACRIDAYGSASDGSAVMPKGERPVDGGVDGELGAAQRPVGSDGPGAARPSGCRGGLDTRVESL